MNNSHPVKDTPQAKIWAETLHPSIAKAWIEQQANTVEVNISSISKKIVENFDVEAAKNISERTRAFVRNTLGPALMAWALGLLGVSSAHASEWEKMRTTAQCINDITMEYDAKIEKAKADGKDKAVAIFERRKWEFLEGCKNYEKITANNEKIAANNKKIAANNEKIATLEQQISALEQQIAAGEQKLVAGEQKLAAGEQKLAAYKKVMAAFKKISPIIKQVSERWSSTSIEMQDLIDGYRDIHNWPESEFKVDLLKNLRYVIERLGGSV